MLPPEVLAAIVTVPPELVSVTLLPAARFSVVCVALLVPLVCNVGPLPPEGVKHPVALPFARTPVAACPVVQVLGVAASAVAVAALPVVLFVRAPSAFTSLAASVCPLTAVPVEE